MLAALDFPEHDADAASCGDGSGCIRVRRRETPPIDCSGEQVAGPSATPAPPFYPVTLSPDPAPIPAPQSRDQTGYANIDPRQSAVAAYVEPQPPDDRRPVLRHAVYAERVGVRLDRGPVLPWALSRNVAADPAVPAVPVGAEFIGKARDLRRRVEREDANLIPTINSLIAPIDARLRKFPARKMRPQILSHLIQSWRLMDRRDFRLDLDAKLERTRCALVERRIAAGRTQFLDADWDGEEPDVAVTEISLSIDGNRFNLRSRILCTFSMHAIARRLQRAQDGSDAALLHDMNVAASIDPSTLSGGGVKVATDEEGGGWRGRVVWMSSNNSEPLPALSIRTWMS
jgi:hypothetical protein